MNSLKTARRRKTRIRRARRNKENYMFGKEIGNWLKNKGPEFFDKLSELGEDLKGIKELNRNLAGVQKELAHINKTVELVANYLKKVVMDNPELASKVLGFIFSMGKDDGGKEKEKE